MKLRRQKSGSLSRVTRDSRNNFLDTASTLFPNLFGDLKALYTIHEASLPFLHTQYRFEPSSLLFADEKDSVEALRLESDLRAWATKYNLDHWLWVQVHAIETLFSWLPEFEGKYAMLWSGPALSYQAEGVPGFRFEHTKWFIYSDLMSRGIPDWDKYEEALDAAYNAAKTTYKNKILDHFNESTEPITKKRNTSDKHFQWAVIREIQGFGPKLIQDAIAEESYQAIERAINDVLDLIDAKP